MQKKHVFVHLAVISECMWSVWEIKKKKKKIKQNTRKNKEKLKKMNKNYEISMKYMIFRNFFIFFPLFWGFVLKFFGIYLIPTIPYQSPSKLNVFRLISGQLVFAGFRSIVMTRILNLTKLGHVTHQNVGIDMENLKMLLKKW